MPQGNFPNEQDKVHGLVVFTGPTNSGVVNSGVFGMMVPNSNGQASGHIWFIGGGGGTDGTAETYLHDQDFTLTGNRVWSRACPANTAAIVVHIEQTNYPIPWYVELQAK